MIYIIATITIAISYVVFFYLFANIFTPLFLDIPATLKLKRKDLINSRPVLKKYIITVFFSGLLTSIILFFTYYFWVNYSFGYSISILIGSSLAILSTIWKMIWMLFRYSDNFFRWLDFYRNDNKYYLITQDLEVINVALGGKSGEIEKRVNDIFTNTTQ